MAVVSNPIIAILQAVDELYDPDIDSSNLSPPSLTKVSKTPWKY